MCFKCHGYIYIYIYVCIWVRITRPLHKGYCKAIFILRRRTDKKSSFYLYFFQQVLCNFTSGLGIKPSTCKVLKLVASSLIHSSLNIICLNSRLFSVILIYKNIQWYSVNGRGFSQVLLMMRLTNLVSELYQLVLLVKKCFPSISWRIKSFDQPVQNNVYSSTLNIYETFRGKEYSTRYAYIHVYTTTIVIIICDVYYLCIDNSNTVYIPLG